MDPPQSADSTFTKPELDHLTAYRAAVRAGFYTDWDGSAEATDTALLAWLGAGRGVADAEAYPFTVDERQRLERIRRAVVAGTYSEELPAADQNATPEQRTR
jgi:hypothetical protein